MVNQTSAALSNCTLSFDIDDQVYQFVSPNLFDFFGLTVQQLIQKTDSLQALIIPEDRERINLQAQLLGTNRRIELQYKITTPQGITKSVTEKRSIVINELNGHKILLSLIWENTGSYISAADGTSSDAKARVREQFLKSLIDSQTNFLIRIDVNGDFTFANKQFLKTFGFTADEIIGRHFSETTIPEEEHIYQEAFKACTGSPGKIVKLRHKKPGKDGRLHDTEWELIAIVDDSGTVCEIQGIGQDITSQKRVQDEALWTKNSLEALINNTDDEIWSVDKKQRYLYMNQSYIHQVTYLTGVEPKKGDYSFKHGGYSKQIIDQWNIYYQRALNGERYSITSESTDPQNGEKLFFEVSFNPIYTTSGDIIGVGCFAHNITQRLKTEQELIDQNERLRNIASLSSHELRRPVASMMGLISIMDRDNFFNPDNLEIIEHLLTVSNEIDDVIRLIVDNTFTGKLPGK